MERKGREREGEHPLDSPVSVCAFLVCSDNLSVFLIEGLRMFHHHIIYISLHGKRIENPFVSVDQIIMNVVEL
jgi:hypothetical protein